MRKVITTIAFLVTLALSMSAVGETILCKPTDSVNARISPSTKSHVEGRYECGDEIETDGVVKTDKQGRKWIHVIDAPFESGEVWVCSMYVQDSPVTVEKCHAYVCANGRTALRRSPNGKRTKWLSNGTSLTVLAYSDEWALTTIGYVSMSCIEFYGGEI